MPAVRYQSSVSLFITASLPCKQASSAHQALAPALQAGTRERRTSQTDSCSAAHGTEEGRIDGTEFGTVRVGFVGLDWVACDAMAMTARAWIDGSQRPERGSWMVREIQS